jgi:methionine-rich copper-binding protein CopC
MSDCIIAKVKPGTISALLFFAFLCAFPQMSWAHAFPDHSDPKVGSTITVAPDRVRIWFDSDIEPAFSTIAVNNAAGSAIDKEDGRLSPSNNKLLEVSVPQLPAGIYKVIWSVVSRDGHRTTGDYTFTIK